jgi:hypothetical protein
MAKQNKSKKVTTNVANEEHKLSPIEKELLGYCKNHQPVLLYGEDKVGRKDLILNVHKANGGLDQSSEHGNPSTFVRGYSTERTWDHVNLALFDSRGIYAYLTNTYASNPLEYSPHDFDERKTSYDEGFFYCCKGLLFLDNLLCSDENKQLSHKLDAHIKDRNTSFQWLVIYAEKLDGLSQNFKEQFKLISLGVEKVAKNGEKLKPRKKSPSKTDNLSKGKGFKIPKDKFYNTLNEVYTYCKKEEAGKEEKWPGTKMAIYAMNLLKKKYGEKYDTDLKQSYLRNLFSKIKNGKLK